MKNKLIISFLILFLSLFSSCGFSPKYSSINGLDFSINLNKVVGDRDLNNSIKSQLRRYEKTDKPDLRIINIDIESKFSKLTISKNSLGEATRYNLKANIKFDLKENGKTKSIIFADEFKIDKIADDVEEKNYIKIIKQNFADLAIDKLISNIRQNR